jgi:cytoskeleton protein RodZ
MTGPVSDQPGGEAVPAPSDAPPSAGARLRAIREAAQLSVDDVAHQLKLARRQVLAIENDDLDALPGPTFVRGFIRNYARLLRIDAAPLLEASNVIVSSAAPIQQLAPTMGELPLETGSGPAWTRWLIPSGLALVLIAGIAYYEFTVVPTPGKKARKESAEAVVAPPATSPEPVAQPASASATDPSPSSEPVANTPPQAAPQPAPATQAAASEPKAAAGTGRLDLQFAGPSWVEVRDARGEILLARTLSATSKQTLTGKLPLSLRIGNASVVRLQFDGRPVDLAPFTRLEIARLTLPPQRP